MKKIKIFMCILVLLIFIVTGCSNNASKTSTMPTHSSNDFYAAQNSEPNGESSQNNSPSNSPSSCSDTRTVAFNSGEYLSDDEFVFAGGVRTGMGYNEVLEILGSYDEAYDNAPGVKSIMKDGVHYGFYQINDTFTNQSDLKTDGVYRLLSLTLTESSDETFPRGIKIGDTIEDVLSKFPGKDKELRKWARQNIYGQDKIGHPRAYLEFAMYDECYHLMVITGKQVMRINFDRKNLVRFIEVHKEDS